MDENEIKYFIEAALLAAGRPLSVDQLHGLFDGRSAPAKAEIRKAIAALLEDYEGRGVTISEVASGFRIQVTATMAERLQKLWEERPPRYSRALFETLALVAYRQPITRGEIEEIRGVSVTPNIVRTLLERDWIRIIGHRDVPGRPEMLGTTRNFLDYFGLKKLEDLPPLADLSDWESLRVQLNLPDVEDGGVSDSDAVVEVPVLYAEIDAEEVEPASQAPEAEVTAPAESGTGEEELVVSEWPDPLAPVASLETTESNDDKDVSANQ
jgi:segregation and condensation protein B